MVDIPRIGMQVTMPGEFNTLTWYGPGPGDTYSDRKISNAIGIYTGKAKELYS